jgi:hypothetical protein
MQPISARFKLRAIVRASNLKNAHLKFQYLMALHINRLLDAHLQPSKVDLVFSLQLAKIQLDWRFYFNAHL